MLDLFFEKIIYCEWELALFLFKMSNWKITDKRIYQLLKHPCQVDRSIVEDMTSAYLDFVEDLFVFLNEGKDNKEIIRKLNTDRKSTRLNSSHT